MTNAISNHLDDLDLDDHLMGCAGEETELHLAACAACRERVFAFESHMAAFNQASLHWSQARSNTINRDISAHRPAFRVTGAAMWSASATLAAALVFGATLSINHPVAAPSTSTAEVHAAHSPVEIDSDNAMLAAINSETSAPPAASFGLYDGTHPQETGSRHASRQVRD